MTTMQQVAELRGYASRFLIAGLLASLLLAAVTVRLSVLYGLIAPIRVASGSMADSLAGPHFALDCPDCGFPIRVGSEYRRRDSRVDCPNCGAWTTDRGATLRPGQRVLVERFHRWHPPRRWQPVALHSPGGAQVKRIVALPGEHVAIRDGDVFVDGRIARKSLAELRPMAILVHDDTHRPTTARDGALPTAWEPIADASGWRAEAAGYRYAPAADRGDDSLDWLRFHYRPRFRPGEAETTAVLDSYGYNQSLSRELREVHDLLLVGRFRVAGSGVLAFEFSDSGDRFRIELDAGQRVCRLFHNDTLAERVSADLLMAAEVWWCEAAICDRQILLAVNAIPLLRYSFDSAGVRKAALHPLAVGARGGAVQASDLRVYRDVHYLHPFGVGWPWSADEPLASDKFFLLGDNSPASRDSRHDLKEVNLSSLIGRVLRRR